MNSLIRLASPRVLVVDDEFALRDILQKGLERSGFSCAVAENALEALAYLKDHAVDVVLTDVVMPGMDGIELCRTIKKLYDVQVIIMTGFSDYTYEEILGHGASDFLNKPMRMPELVTRLRRVLTEHATHQERDHALEEAQGLTGKLQAALDGIVDAMSMTVEYKDPYTAGHQRRVAEIACAVAARLGLTQDQIYGLRIAGRIHDLGKITVPSEILCKPGVLDPLEYDLMKRHVDVGYHILKNITFPWAVADFVWQHHERLDGSGYPRGLHKDEILPESRILAVADVFETMTTHRPYRPSRGATAAFEEMALGRGVRYDADVVDAVLELYGDMLRPAQPEAPKPAEPAPCDCPPGEAPTTPPP